MPIISPAIIASPSRMIARYDDPIKTWNAIRRQIVTGRQLTGIIGRMLKFDITHENQTTLARRAVISLFHGQVQTPAFMPVGTVGAVKTLLPEEVKALGADIILGNTYHLYLRPGHEAINRYGGIQAWNRWSGPVLTDSGGFQVFSLGGRNRVIDDLGQPADQPLRADRPVYDADDTDTGFVKITEEGARFKSHIDGQEHFFIPESAVDIQLKIGSDIMMVLDECTEFPATAERARLSMERTHRWALRALEHWQAIQINNPELAAKHNLFGIAQGSTFQDLRIESVKKISAMPFDGVAVGGVSVGEGKDYMYQVMEWTGELLPREKPHYLMGIGEPADIIRAVAHGYDMFDCVLPTRLGRYGVVWRAERDGAGDYADFVKWDLRAARFRDNRAVIDSHCGCPTCAGGYSTGFIGHLLREREVVGIRLTTMHNLWTLLNLMREIRRSIETNDFNQQFAVFLGPW